ncbi:hypothetical protein AB4Y43_17060 [Paraburkholderia sp. BR10872]|uniref:hypothetical protein n=1 Tax=Paraburkholderia sp. BR10872 TaxID=3236989 RepID=UPI0034D1864F
MATAPIAQSMRAKRLIPRLDACVSRIDTNSELFQHVAVYGGFLTDLLGGRVPGGTDQNDELLGLVEEFCTLIEADSPAAH